MAVPSPELGQPSKWAFHRRRASFSFGDDSSRATEVRKAFTPPARDARAEALRNAKNLLGTWLNDENLRARLALHDVTAETLVELEAAAAGLETATATRRSSAAGRPG